MSSTTTTTTTPTREIPSWNMKADYVETCNCDYGCPCNLSGFPTYGNCQALLLFHIRSGSYGNTKLDGVDFILAQSWPKAIHEGNGTVLLLITDKANEEQRKAIIQIVSGQAKGECFALFVPTISRFLEPQFVDINAKIDGRKSSFSVPGLVNVEVESFKNPVTGEEQDAKIQLPKGLVWKIADVAKSKIMRITSPELNYDHSGKNAFYSVVEFKGP
ncbi:MAG: DUF1326 domain-containing protein [Thermoproteota archaeon]|nr:DUF1326 domain-containing protein [Thermoproteota archaeon]